MSDKPGEHDFELLRRLVLPDGSVLRASQPARPCRESLFTDVLRDGKSLLKVSCPPTESIPVLFFGHQDDGCILFPPSPSSDPQLWTTNAYCGVVGLFHLQGSSWDRGKRKFYVHDKAPKPLTGQVRPRDVETFAAQSSQAGNRQQQTAYAAYPITSKELRVLGHDEPIGIELPTATGELVVISPLVEAGGVQFAPIGLEDMFNCGGAVRSCAPLPAAGRGGKPKDAGFCFSVRGCGRFLCYSSREPLRVLVANGGGMELHCGYDAAIGALRFDVPAVKGLACELQVLFR